MSELKSLNDLFKNSIFRIPNYQRGYSWGEEQLNDFWEDLINLPDNNEHYTGMLSLKELDKETDKTELNNWVNEQWLLNKDYHAYQVVDGQQRLTTIIILLQAIIEFYRKNYNVKDEDIIINDTRLTEIIEQFILKEKPGSDGLIKTYLFGYQVDKPSDDYLKNKILNPKYVGEINESFYTSNLDFAKQFFDKKINDLYENNKDFLEIEKIYRKITNRFKFNIYVISKNFNVNVAFETMNNRGKKLSNLELLKNRLIYLTSLLSLPQDEEKSLIDNINESWKIVYSYLGKDKIEKLDDDEFLIAHSYIYFGYIEEIRRGYSKFLLNKYFNQLRIFKGIENNVENIEEDLDDENEYSSHADLSQKLTKKDIMDYVESLKELIPYWYMLNFSMYPNNILNKWLTRLKRIDYNYFKPLILVVLAKTYISDDKKIELIKYVERFIFVNFRLSGYQATYSRHIYYKFTNLLYLDKIDIDEIINNLKNINQLSANGVIDLDLGVLSTVNRLFKREGFYRWNLIRYFLFEYEQYLVEKYNGVAKIIPEDYFNTNKKNDKVSIEHVFPQSESSDYWLNIFKKYDLQQRNKFRGTLGNLIPLSLDINRKLQDDNFEEKKARYKMGSYSEMEVSNYVNENNISIWDDNAILLRGMELVSFLENRWEVKFKNDEDRKKFLGLDFLITEEDKNKNVIEVIAKAEENKIQYTYPDLQEPLYIEVNGIRYATGYYKNGGILIKQNSIIRPEVKSPDIYNKIIEERSKANIKDNKFIDDCFYDSPSKAAYVILGINSNGWTVWKNDNNISLNELVGRKF